MLFIAAAMRFEALPIIDAMSLKKDVSHSRFQIYRGFMAYPVDGKLLQEDISVIITGIGKINAAEAVTYLYSHFTGTFPIINIGICASFNKDIKIGSLALCNSILDHSAGYYHYPDMMLKHPLLECSITSFDKAVKEIVPNAETDLLDMEASGIFHAASRFVSTDQIHCLKIVSDYLEPDSVSPEQITDLINKNLSQISEYIFMVIKYNVLYKNVILSNDDVCIIERIVKAFKFTTSMKNHLYRYSRYLKLKEGSIRSVFETTGVATDISLQGTGSAINSNIESDTGVFPGNKNKSEGKKILDAIRKYID